MCVPAGGLGEARSSAVPVAVHCHVSPGSNTWFASAAAAAAQLGVTPVTLSVTTTSAAATFVAPVLVMSYRHVTAPPAEMSGTPAAFGSLASAPFVYLTIDTPGFRGGLQ